jgi:hypothetical protein
MIKLINKIINNNIFLKKPIILMHIGSDGSNFSTWRKIAANSILISVDPLMTKEQNKTFLKVNYVQKIIDGKNGVKTFYTTKDSHCSSLLEPKKTEYSKWYGAHRFKVVKKEKHKVSSLNSILKALKINYIDWLVIDAQGVDLNIFSNIDKKIQSKISILDLEPGFFEFYKKADSISEVFEYTKKNFEFEDITFGYNYRVNSKSLSKLDKKILYRFNKPSKIYSNITFVNKNNNNERILLLKIIYLISKKKFFEAKNMLLSYKNISLSKEIVKIINFRILLHKIIYCLLIPTYLFKKILNILSNK